MTTLTHPLRLADLPSRKPTHFDLSPDDAALAALAAELELHN